MKKILVGIMVIITMMLTGCVPASTSDAMTDDQIQEIVNQYLDNIDVENYVSTTYDLQGYEASIVDMINQVRTSVVGIISESDISAGSGSGVIYKHVDDTYYMVTNQHVVVHTDPLTNEDHIATNLSIVYEKNGLFFQIDNSDITLVGTDPTTDLAVLTFQSSEDFAIATFADSYQIEVGQFVYAIGNPLGFDYYGTVTSGIVSGLARYVVDGDFNATLLQHDAPISPGNSGGGLFNTNGELIGINNMKVVSDNASGIGFAIPSNTVKRIVTDLEDDGLVTRPYLGISTYAQINDCGLDYGVCVVVETGLTPPAAAEQTGLIDGDVIVGYKLETEGEYLAINNFNDLKEAILNSSVGDGIVLQYYRNNGTAENPDWVLYDSETGILGIHPDDQN